MPTTIKEERYRCIKPILDKEVKIKDVAKISTHSERSIKRWLCAYRAKGMNGLEPKSTRPKTHRCDTLIRTKERVLEIRKQEGLCALKINYRLKKENVKIGLSTISKILKTEGVTRKYKVRKLKYKYIKVPLQPGELVEIDVKYVPDLITGKRFYQYTAIDKATRWRYLQAYEEQTTTNSILFLKEVMYSFKHRIRAIKTDNGSIFTNYYVGTNKRSDQTVKNIHALDIFCRDNGIIHYLIDPGKPAQNGTVERSHREDQEKFYERNTFVSFVDLKNKMIIWNNYYNNLEHCSLDGKTPNEMLELRDICV